MEVDNVEMGDKSEDGLAFATMCSIFKGTCKFTSLYKPYEVRKEVTMKEVCLLYYYDNFFKIIYYKKKKDKIRRTCGIWG